VTDAGGWTSYVGDFHAERTGITEDLLGGARDAGGRTAYDWVVEPVPRGADVLDLACGNGPVARLVTGTYVGVDRSADELRLARQRDLAVVQADAGRLPVRDGSVDAVVVSMGLVLLPLPAALHEVARVLRPGGVLVATLPHSRPLPVADRLRWTRLLLALRQRRLVHPNDEVLARPGPGLAAAGLELRSDETAGFRCPLPDAAAAALLVDSLYLPGADPARVAAARRLAQRWAGSSITVPLRRLVAVRG
jgi:SAM-dependent methyltransferase